MLEPTFADILKNDHLKYFRLWLYQKMKMISQIFLNQVLPVFCLSYLWRSAWSSSSSSCSGPTPSSSTTGRSGSGSKITVFLCQGLEQEYQLFWWPDAEGGEAGPVVQVGGGGGQRVFLHILHTRLVTEIVRTHRRFTLIALGSQEEVTLHQRRFTFHHFSSRINLTLPHHNLMWKTVL